MKILSRFCGIVSVLFLVACIVACGARAERSKTKTSEKTRAKTAKSVQTRIRGKTKTSAKTAKTRVRSKTKKTR